MKNTYLLLLLLLITALTQCQSGINQQMLVDTVLVNRSLANETEIHAMYIPVIATRPDPDLPPGGWAFEETFEHDPDAPSQSLLPQTFDYAVTHRTHPAHHFEAFASYPADHGTDCTGPNPAISPLPQHSVVTSHFSHGSFPDKSFFICKNHMMSSMGDVAGYSVTAFWPRQEFDFSQGGILEFDVNISGNHPRSWFEILITPRAQLKIGAAPEWLPIDETYPQDRIVLKFDDRITRYIQVGTGAIDPEGIIFDVADWQSWADAFPNDPANNDRRIRRTMRIKFDSSQIIWSIEKEDGSYNDFKVTIPGDWPFTRGLVVFKTHAYTPEKDGNHDNYTFHWDNIRFSGPVVGRYTAIEAEDVVYLQANGDREIGEQATITIDLPAVGSMPVLFGQVHNPIQGQVLLSINGAPHLTINPYDYNLGSCSSSGWKSFQLNLDPALLSTGSNTFTWTIGPRPTCAEEHLWNGFSIKSLEVQFDASN